MIPTASENGKAESGIIPGRVELEALCLSTPRASRVWRWRIGTSGWSPFAFGKAGVPLLQHSVGNGSLDGRVCCGDVL